MSQGIDLKVIRDRAAEAKARADAATAGPWEWWTSCSFRRLSSRATGKDGDVLHGVVHRDGHQDIQVSDADAVFIAAARTDVPSLCNDVNVLAAETERLRAVEAMARDVVDVCEAWSKGDTDAAEIYHDASKLKAALKGTREAK